eukprot:UN10711
MVHSINTAMPPPNNNAFIIINNQYIDHHNPYNNNPHHMHMPHMNNNNNINADIIDLTHEEAEEEQKEEFVPWNESDVPPEFKCPISLEIMRDPVILSDGFYYERECILDWLHQHTRSPMTNLPIPHITIQAGDELKRKILKWTNRQWQEYREHLQANCSDNSDVEQNMNEDNDINMQTKI